MGTVSDATRGSGEISKPFGSGGSCPEETVCNARGESCGVRATLWGFLDGAGEGLIPG
jgi:hypothetical protein